MPQIIHPPDPWGGPRFAMDVFAALLGAWDKIQNIQERKETRELLNQARATELLMHALGMEDEWIKKNSEYINKLAQQAKMPDVVSEGKVYRPTDVQLKQKLAQLESKKADVAQQVLEELGGSKEIGTAIGLHQLGLSPTYPLDVKEKEAKLKKLEVETELTQEEIQRMRQRTPYEILLMQHDIDLKKAQTALSYAKGMLIQRKIMEEPQTKVKITEGAWDDSETGKVVKGFIVFDQAGNVRSKIPLMVLSQEPKAVESEQKAIAKTMSEYMKQVGRPAVDWESEKEVNRLASRFTPVGDVSVVNIGTPKKPKYSIRIKGKLSNAIHSIGPAPDVIEEEFTSEEQQGISAFKEVLESFRSLP